MQTKFIGYLSNDTNYVTEKSAKNITAHQTPEIEK